MKTMDAARKEKLIRKAHALLDEAEKCIKIITSRVGEDRKKAA